MRSVIPLRALACLAALLMLAGCQLRADVEVVIDADGGGTVALVLEPDTALDAEARAAGYDLAGTLTEAVRDVDGWQTDTSERQVLLSTTVTDADALRRVTGDLANALAAPELQPFDAFQVSVEDRFVTVETQAGLVVGGAVEALGLAPADAEAVLRESVRYTMSIEMPGEILTHNADRQDGNRLTWDVPAGTTVDVSAESELPPGLPMAWLGLGAALVVLALIVLARIVAGRRRRRWR